MNPPPPQFWTAFYMGSPFSSLHCNKADYFKISLSTIGYTRLNDLKFKFPKIFWRGASSQSPLGPSPDPSSIFFWLRPRFELRPQISCPRDSGFDSDPQLLKAWLRPSLKPPDSNKRVWLGVWRFETIVAPLTSTIFLCAFLMTTNSQYIARDYNVGLYYWRTVL